MKNMLFKSLTAMFLVITLCSLTACGGGGGGSSQLPPTTANVKVSIQGDLFSKIISPDIRVSQIEQTVQSLKIRAIAYDNNKGNEVPGVQHINTVATYTPDGDYIAKVNGLSKDFDYRIAVLFGEGDNTRVLLQNHIDATSIKENATFKINDISNKKVLAYEKWLENSTDKKFNTFHAECSKEASKKGYSEDFYFDSLVNFSKSELKESLINITDGTDPNASLPTSASVDTEKLPENSGGSKVSVTSNVTVTIDGADFQVNGSFRKVTDGNDIIVLKTTAYLKGSLKNDIKVTDRIATKSGSNYVCEVQGLVSGYDYRFSAYYNGNKLMENQIAVSELQNNAEILVNIVTSIKTLAYDSWKSKSPSNASFENFKQNCELAGLSQNNDFQNLFDINTYKQILVEILKGDKNAFLPKKEDIDTKQISTSDLERPLTEIEKNLIGKWYLNYHNNYHRIPDSEGNIESVEFYKNQTFTYTSYSYTYNENVRYCNSNNATGTWSLEDDKILLNYSDGDYDNIGKLSDVVLRNDILACNHNTYYGSEYIYTDEEIFKKTKWSFETRMPEPASATQALIGEWTLTSVDGFKIKPDSNGNMQKTFLYSDHTYYIKSADISIGDPIQMTIVADDRELRGKWFYEFGVLYLERPGNANVYYSGDKIISINNNSIKVNGDSFYGYIREMTKTSSDSSD